MADRRFAGMPVVKSAIIAALEQATRESWEGYRRMPSSSDAVTWIWFAPRWS
jgi:hypothetical protein